ncbi:MAG: Hsp20/alpha crystallin family protein [Permianibacter sp.]
MSEKTTATRSPEETREQAALLPPVDVFEDSRGITLYADLPGVSKDKLNIQVDADSLVIEGELALDTPAEMEANHAEVTRPLYRRVFTLSRELDSAKVEAEFRQGVLALRIPKAEHAQPRRIEVKLA